MILPKAASTAERQTMSPTPALEVPENARISSSVMMMSSVGSAGVPLSSTKSAAVSSIASSAFRNRPSMMPSLLVSASLSPWVALIDQTKLRSPTSKSPSRPAVACHRNCSRLFDESIMSLLKRCSTKLVSPASVMIWRAWSFTNGWLTGNVSAPLVPLKAKVWKPPWFTSSVACELANSTSAENSIRSVMS